MLKEFVKKMFRRSDLEEKVWGFGKKLGDVGKVWGCW